MQFPYLLSGDVILFQLDPPPPLSFPPLIALSLSISGWFALFYPSAFNGKRGRRKRDPGMPPRRGGKTCSPKLDSRASFRDEEREDWPLQRRGFAGKRLKMSQDWKRLTDFPESVWRWERILICGLISWRRTDQICFSAMRNSFLE